MSLPQAAFSPGLHSIELGKIVALRTITTNMRSSRKYRAIASSDGGARHDRAAGCSSCAERFRDVSSAGWSSAGGHSASPRGDQRAMPHRKGDDEAYTYNRHINPLSTIQEHRMLVKALNDGVSEERIARVLHLDLKTLRQKRELLVGICAEAADLLKDKPISLGCFALFRKMTPLRQIEAAELMVTISNYSAVLAKTILAASAPDQLVKPGGRKAPKAMTPEQIAHLEQEEHDQLSSGLLAALKDTYGAERLELQVACRYLNTILVNPRLRKISHQATPRLAEGTRTDRGKDAYAQAIIRHSRLSKVADCDRQGVGRATGISVVASTRSSKLGGASGVVGAGGVLAAVFSAIFRFESASLV